MIIRVRDIGESAEEVELEQPVSLINAILANGPSEDYRCDRTVRLSLSHYRAGDDLFFEGAIRTGIAGRCARCLEDYRFDIDEPFRFVVTPRDGVSSLGQDEDVEVSAYQGEEVDLAPLVCEQVLLSLPTMPLCDENCSGLCPSCGTNLNRARCACTKDEGDPRLAIFRTLRVDQGQE